jgi:DUF971 family protein
VDGKLRLPLLGQPDPNIPKDVHLVGRYALGVDWADGHGSIYPFEALRRACSCDACAAVASAGTGAGTGAPLTAAMTWPDEIARVANALRVVWSDRHESLYPYAELRASCRCAGCTGGH